MTKHIYQHLNVRNEDGSLVTVSYDRPHFAAVPFDPNKLQKQKSTDTEHVGFRPYYESALDTVSTLVKEFKENHDSKPHIAAVMSRIAMGMMFHRFERMSHKTVSAHADSQTLSLIDHAQLGDASQLDLLRLAAQAPELEGIEMAKLTHFEWAQTKEMDIDLELTIDAMASEYPRAIYDPEIRFYVGDIEIESDLVTHEIVQKDEEAIPTATIITKRVVAAFETEFGILSVLQRDTYLLDLAVNKDDDSENAQFMKKLKAELERWKNIRIKAGIAGGRKLQLFNPGSLIYQFLERETSKPRNDKHQALYPIARANYACHTQIAERFVSSPTSIEA